MANLPPFSSVTVKAAALAAAVGLSFCVTGRPGMAAPGLQVQAGSLPGEPGQIIVEFRVRNTGFNGAGFVELYSLPDWDDPGCFFLRIPVSAKPSFAEAGIHDIARHFAGKRVRVRGAVKILQFGKSIHPAIVVDGPGRIEVLADTPDFIPTHRYATDEIEGFAILVSPELDLHPREKEAALAELRRQIAFIRAAVPSSHLPILLQTRIWIEWNAKPHGAAEHHPDEHWLRRNGYNPDKTGDVEICNARHFVKWSRSAQPCMLLHEMAHSYHHRTRERNQPLIEAAYRGAMASGRYESVAHVDGGPPRKAYAAKNPAEYFAELTEAWFGKNDFAPFDRAGLKTHDPDGYELMNQTWGNPVSP